MGQKELSIHFQEMGELTDELQEIAEEIKNLIQGKGEEILTSAEQLAGRRRRKIQKEGGRTA